MSSKRIGVLTSGGDCPGLNAVLHGVVSAATTRGYEVLGFLDGYEGLLNPVRYQRLDPNSVADAWETPYDNKNNPDTHGKLS